MKRLLILAVTAVFSLTALQSCFVEVIDEPVYGPPGRPGNAFFGISYQVQHPYSYWDNNPAVPYNPVINQYYATAPGLYEFEYFINPQEFWYGYYEVFINPGGPGQPYNTPGLNGLDTYLLLICDPNGYYEIRNSYKMSQDAEGFTVIESQDPEQPFRIKIKKGNPAERQTHPPKYIHK